MMKFIASHQDQISGVLSGFDRLVFRGTLRSIAYAAGMQQYLSSNDVLLKHFGAHVEQVSQRLKAASLAEGVATGRPVRYLASAKASKEDIARRIAVEDGVTQGLVRGADQRRDVPQRRGLPRPREANICWRQV